MTEGLHKQTDTGILKGVAEGIERSMEHCISKYGGLVWTIAKRYVKNQTSAEDVVQETFTDLWKSAKKYDPSIATECTFIGMLARRRAIDFARKESRRPQFEPLPETDSLTEISAEPSASVRLESEDVRKALKLLPKETQLIFSLHFDQGMSHPEISQKVDLPLGTVKTRLRRGLIEVRNHLRRQEGTELSTPA
ncbi:MAG: RNA polymerase sigma factor [Akkermansiaceae bacterium]